MATPKNRIVWSLDPFGDVAEDSAKAAAKAIEALVEQEDVAVEPVYVLSPDGFNWSGDFSPGWVKEFKPVVLEAMEKAIDSLQIKTLPPKIIVNKRLSLRGDTQKVLNYAKRTGAKMVVMTTHARKGLSRMVLGSFAETSLLHTKTPLLLVNPQAEDVKFFKKILFATDLSKESKRGFKKILKQAKAWNAEIVIFHKLPDPIEPVVQTGVQIAGGGWVSVQQFLSKEGKKRTQTCEKWAAEAKKAGVKASVVVDDRAGFVTDAIIDEAKSKDCDIIALVSKTGSVASVLIGSIARQVVRASPVPVYILHYDSH